MEAEGGRHDPRSGGWGRQRGESGDLKRKYPPPLEGIAEVHESLTRRGLTKKREGAHWPPPSETPGVGFFGRGFASGILNQNYAMLLQCTRSTDLGRRCTVTTRLRVAKRRNKTLYILK